MDQKTRERAQHAARGACEKMLKFLLEFDPAEKLTVSDVKFIARMTSDIAFSAIHDTLSTPPTPT